MVTGPVPPGTGVRCPATSTADGEVDIADQFAIDLAGAEVDHGGARLHQVAGDESGRPAAANSRSAWRVSAGRSTVREWQTTTVQSA